MSEETQTPIFPAGRTGMFDAFEYWLQGRINLCVTGLQDQITRLEIRNNELEKKLEESGCSESKQESEDRFHAEMRNWLDGNDIEDYLDHRAIWNMIEDDVDTAIDDKGVGLSDEDLEEKIKDVVRDNLTFEVTVS